MSWYHLARLTPDSEKYREECVKDAEKACAHSDEKKFLSWWDHIQASLPALQNQT